MTEEEDVHEEPVVEAEPEPVVEAAPEPVPEPLEEKPDFSAASASQPAQEVSSDLFGSFSVGSIK